MPPCDAGKKKQAAVDHDEPLNGGSEASTTVIVKKPGQPVYVRCDSSEPFVNPTVPDSTREQTAAEINQSLNLNLGQRLLSPENNKKLIKVIKFLNKFLVSWWEHVVFKIWNKVPLSVRRKITYLAWKLYYPLHKLLLGRSTAIHPDASPEYHALTTAMWGGRFFPVTVDRMRFSLGQLTAAHPTPLQSTTVVEEIDEPCAMTGAAVPNVQKDHCNVHGMFLHQRPTSNAPPTEYTLFWLYGGAFLAGDAKGNMGPADYVGSNCDMDVFIPTYRLAPESDIHDLLWDVAVAYRWLYLLKQKRNQDPTKIILFGCSSGAALCTRLMQFFAELERGEELLPSYIAPILGDIRMPAAGILASPYVDYRPPKPDGSFLQYSQHDLIVNQSVLEVGLPFLDTHMCDRRTEHTPINRSLAGLPPLCVLVSEHETVYDESCLLVNKARAAGTQVTVGMWKYMCHVWCFLGGFVPEGKQSMDFMCEWIQEQQEKNR